VVEEKEVEVVEVEEKEVEVEVRIHTPRISFIWIKERGDF
jgi:hypothetical protein